MTVFTQWIMSVLGMVLIGAIIDLVIPKGRLGGIIQAAFSLATVAVLILPLPSVIKSCNTQVTQPNFNATQNYGDYADYVEKVKLDYLARGVEKALADAGIEGAQVKLSGTVSGETIKIDSAEINLSKAVIDENSEHINKYEHVENLVIEYLNLEIGAITII